MERGSSISRIVGSMSEEKRTEQTKRMDDIFNSESPYQFELEKTAAELQVISFVSEELRNFFNEYNVATKDMPTKNIHLIQNDHWDAYGGARNQAFYQQGKQAVFIPDRGSLTWIAEALTHELIHFQAYNAIQKTTGSSPRIGTYRMGISVVNREGSAKFLTNINEAVTQEITMQLMKKILDNPLFTQEREMTEKNKKATLHKDNDRIIYLSIDAIDGRQIVIKQGRERECKLLALLINQILKVKSSEFKTIDEIFHLFAKAAITGNILPIGRLIDGTFGPGTLRRIGSLDNDLDAQLALVESLVPTQSADSTRK